MHLPDRSQVFGAVVGDCVYKALLDLFKFVKKFQKYNKKNKKILLMIVDFNLLKFWLRISQGLRAIRCDPPYLPGNFHSDKDT